MQEYLSPKQAKELSGLTPHELAVLGDHGIIKMRRSKSWRDYEKSSLVKFCSRQRPTIEPRPLTKPRYVPHERNGLLTQAELIEELNTSHIRLQKVRSRTPQFPKPVIHGKREFWREEDIDEIKRCFDECPKYDAANTACEAEAKGYYTVLGAARYLDMPSITLDSWITRGGFHKPEHTFPKSRFAFYKRSELDKLKKQRAKYFARKHTTNNEPRRRDVA